VSERPATGERVAVVTGASRGIGAATCRRLAADGWALVLVARSVEGLERVAASLPAAGREHVVHACDLADPDAVTALAATIRSSHPILDALVNNAAVGTVGPLSTQLEHWDEIQATNLRTPVTLVEELRDELGRSRQPGGAAVVNIGSLFGTGAVAGSLAYVASKAALHAVTRSLAVELGPLGIRVNAIAPGFIRTDMFTTSHPPARQLAIAEAAPLGRVGTPDDVAAVVSFLCSPDSAFVSGAVVPVDGGLVTKLAIPDIRDGAGEVSPGG
jgi:NAD(P)-dependent dehydrogenase (short-subunit alcohol dehydrogenase family)